MAKKLISEQPIGFLGYQQDQYVDNRITTPIGQAIYDPRTPSVKAMDDLAQKQALEDVSLDWAIPAAQGTQFLLRGTAGLGLSRFNHLKELKNLGPGHINDIGRREAMQLGGKGLAAGAVVSSPILNLTSKSLYNIVPKTMTAPVNIDKLDKIRNLADTTREFYQTGRYINPSATNVAPSMIKALNNKAKAVDDILVNLRNKGNIVTRRDVKGEYMSPEMVGDSGKVIQLTKNKNGEYINPQGNTMKGESIEAGDIHSGHHSKKDSIPKSLQETLNKSKAQIDKLAAQTERIGDKARNRYDKALVSKEPMLSPQDLNKLIKAKRKKLEKVKKEDDKIIDFDEDLGGPIEVDNFKKMNKIDQYNEEIYSLETQLEKLAETGKYGKLSK